MNSFKSRISELIDQRNALTQKKQVQLNAEMEEIEKLEGRFSEHARQILDDVIVPRMQVLQESFSGTSISNPPVGFGSKVEFNTDRRYNATIECEFKLQLDREREKILVIWRFHLLPILMEFQTDGLLSIGLESSDRVEIESYVEEKIEQAVQTYFRFLDHPQYQKDNLVVDPVCKMSINRMEAGYREEYLGKEYCFCTLKCKEAFAENPERYVGAK
jgi:YHS domain-containing protein